MHFLAPAPARSEDRSRTQFRIGPVALSVAGIASASRPGSSDIGDDGSDPALHVEVDALPAPVPEGFVHDGAMEWSTDGDELRVRCDGGDARVSPSRGARFRAEAHVWPFDWALPRVLEAIALSLLSRGGGLVLHAVAVEIGTSAVLFIGPSGAGKSTAAELVSGGRYLSLDRAVVMPDSEGYVVFGLAGGSPVALPPSARHLVPVRAILRVRQGLGTPRLRRTEPWEAFFAVRESVQRPPNASEDECMEAVVRLCRTVFVGEVETVLGSDLRPILERGIG